MATTLGAINTGDWTYIDARFNDSTITSGNSTKVQFAHVIVSCDLDSTNNYDVSLDLFSSLAEKFSSMLRLQIQLHFPNQSTSSKCGIELGKWTDSMVRAALDMRFENYCEIYVAMTDQSHLYRPSSTQLVALGEGEEDNASVTILSHKGSLVQVGMTTS